MTVTMTATTTATIDVSAIPAYHTVGIGAGPANLSLAALMQTHTEESVALFDRAPRTAWHDPLLHRGVRMQTSWLKDLVSLVDPTHKLSFLNYLVTEGRLFAMMNSQFDFIPRREYMRYLTWAAARVDNVHYGVDVEEVAFAEEAGFLVMSGGEPVARGEHLVIGVGTRPSVPAGLADLPAERCFIADELAIRLEEMDPSGPVAVVGGGQTGVEVVLRLLSAGFTDIKWLGRRQWFNTIDDSPVANDFYRPAHMNFLQELGRGTRRRLVEDQNNTGDACTPGALRALYQANYDGLLELGRFPVTLLPGRDVVSGEEAGERIRLHATTVEAAEDHEVTHAVIAVGRQSAPMPLAADLRSRLVLDEDGQIIIEPDYSVRWDGAENNKIYALNRARFSHGIPDANLTLLPVRAATVINSVLDKEIFTLRDELCPIQWG